MTLTSKYVVSALNLPAGCSAITCLNRCKISMPLIESGNNWQADQIAKKIPDTRTLTFLPGSKKAETAIQRPTKEFPEKLPEGLQEKIAENVHGTQINMVSQIVIPRFVAGRIKHFTKNWKGLATDSYILNIVTGCKIDLQKIPF